MADNISKTVVKEIAGIGNKVVDHLDQVASGVGGVIKSTSDALRGDLSNVAGQIGSHVGDVVGPEVAEMTKTVSSMGTNLAKSIFDFGGNKEPKTDKKRNSLLQSIVDHFKSEDKRLARETGKKRGLGSKILLGIIATFGLLIGSLVRSLSLPFEVLFKTLKFVGRIAKSIFKLRIFEDIFGKSGIIAKWAISFQKRFLGLTFFISKSFDNIKSFFKPIGKVINKVKIVLVNIVKSFGKLTEMKGLFGTLFKSIKVGFKILGWPLVLILGLIDFIKGFMGTEGSMVDKIKGGLIAAIKGFFLPIIWVFDWVGKKLGIGKIGTQIFEKVSKLFGYIIDGIAWIIKPIANMIIWIKNDIMKIINIISNLFKPLIEYIKSFQSNLWEVYIKPILGDIVNAIANFLMLIPDMLIGFIEGFKKDGFLKGLEGMFTPLVDFLISIPKMIVEWIKKIPGIGKLIGVNIMPKKVWSEKENRMIPKKETPVKNIITTKKETPVKRISKLQEEKVKINKVKEEKKEQKRKKEMDDIKSGQVKQKEAINTQTNIITQVGASQVPQPLPEEIPTEIDNYVLGLAILGI